MGKVRICHLDERTALEKLRADFERMHPTLHMSRIEVDGESTLRSGHGGMRTFWLYSGEGEVFLPEGCRSKEGDGTLLPPSYRAEGMDHELAERLEYLAAHLGSVTSPARDAVEAILARRRGEAYVGDYAGDLWKLCQIAGPWSEDRDTLNAIEYLFRVYRDCGYSVKTESSYEPVMAGDQLVVAGDEELTVRGRFTCLSFEKVDRLSRHVAPAMRLRYLRDSAGGCNFSFDPFRRLPLTWHVNLKGETGDGLNFVNSHVVNIAEETSPTHFHPSTPIGGGEPQTEMYLVLDPKDYHLHTYGRNARLVTYPDLHDLTRFEIHELKPGDFVYIPAGTGHRGMDVFVNVLTVPGFKPLNEYYIDREIQDRTGDAAPYNNNLLDLRNYEAIEPLLG